ncbi:MAG: 2Fe-2S iron-sulfur cluster-binding protein [Fibrobacter sp.]|nr:2Fe-2S iron-sulfur cluster-binding protein [Fibrobacter sp.]
MSNYYNMPKLPTESSPKVEIFVDDKAVMVPGDTNLLEALKAVGIETPHVCYHPYLPVSGNCRQCLVEQEGPRGRMLVIACYTPVAPGMKIYTPASSARVKNARKATQEFMLVNHPLDCPICDKAGECTLQENYMECGQNEGRLRPEYGKNYHGNPAHQFVDSKGQVRGGKHVDIGPRILLDEERCVQCDRCVRFMRSVAGDEQLQLAGRADHTYITTFPGEKLDHEYDLCVTDVCPTGAMTAKYFRFQKRVWLLSHTPTISMDDSLGANIWIDHADGKIYRVMPRCNPEVNRSWLSNTSRMAFQNFNKNRLPAIGGISVMKDAIASASGKIALVAGGECTIEDLAALRMLKETLGDRAEIFAGTLKVKSEPDGIAKSGDPMANRAGFKLLGLPDDNLYDLAQHVSDYSVVVCVNNDIIGEGNKSMDAIEKIPTRIVLSAFNDETASKATLAFGIKHWSEVQGTMVNSLNILQKLNAAPTAPDAELKPAYEVLSELAGKPFTCAYDAFKKAAEYAPALAGLAYDTIKSTGLHLEGGNA